MRKFILSFYLILVPVFGSASFEVTRAQYVMGTICEIRARGPSAESVNGAITAAFLEIVRLENILSLYRSDSEVSELIRLPENTEHGASPELFELLEQSLLFSRKTGGAFDITLQNQGFNNIFLDKKSQSIFLKKSGLRLDFGGIGKGYALDRAAAILKKQGVSEAQLNFSGNILIFNDLESVTAILADPLDSQKTILELNISNGSVSTSSQLERKNHILDPKTGHPVDFQGSVTVISPTATEADALSTALLVLGYKKGIPFLKKEFPRSAAFFLVPSQTGWTKTMSKNFYKFIKE